MTHRFKIALAIEFGIEAAILLDDFHFNICRNRANEKNFFDGRYWTYNSQKAYCELFPYLSRDQIRRTLKKLVDIGIIIKGNYNTNPYDRTSWYAFTDSGWSLVDSYYFHIPKSPNACGENNQCTLSENNQPIPSTISTNTNISLTSSHEDSDKDIVSDVNMSMPTSSKKKNVGAATDRLIADEREQLFEDLWVLYERKGNKQIAKKEFAKLELTKEDVIRIKKHIPAYFESVSERRFRLDFERYLKRETFKTVVYSRQNDILYDPEATAEVQKQEPIEKDASTVVINGITYR